MPCDAVLSTDATLIRPNSYLPTQTATHFHWHLRSTHSRTLTIMHSLARTLAYSHSTRTRALAALHPRFCTRYRTHRMTWVADPVQYTLEPLIENQKVLGVLEITDIQVANLFLTELLSSKEFTKTGLRMLITILRKGLSSQEADDFDELDGEDLFLAEVSYSPCSTLSLSPPKHVLALRTSSSDVGRTMSL